MSCTMGCTPGYGHDSRCGEFNGSVNGVPYFAGAPDPRAVREIANDRVLGLRRSSRIHLSLPEAVTLRLAHEQRIYREHGVDAPACGFCPSPDAPKGDCPEHGYPA